jgi:uncharacterized membrane protein
MTMARDAGHPAAVATAARTARLPAVDVLRAFALFAMIGYHFAFDLRYFRVIHTDFEHDPMILVVRSAILSAFLLLAGVSLVLAARAGASPARFWRRIGEIAACALLVSAASYAMFPKSYIWFGVLHAIAVTLIVARPFALQPRIAFAIGIVVIAAGLLLSNHAFDTRALDWIGFRTYKPFTEDYVPLFPWSGVVFLGIAFGHALARDDFAAIASLSRAPAWLAVAGRHTLLIYMIHQPILIGALWLVLRR